MTRSWPRAPTSPTVRVRCAVPSKLIEDPLSEELLAGEWGEGDTVLCDVADGKFVFSHGTGEIPAPRPAGTLGGDTAPAAPHTGNAAPVSGGVTSGPGGMMQAGSGAL